MMRLSCIVSRSSCASTISESELGMYFCSSFERSSALSVHAASETSETEARLETLLRATACSGSG